MKIMVASDIHGAYEYAKKMLEIAEEINADKLILLGDLYYHGPRNNLPLEYNPKEVSKMLNEYNKGHEMLVIKGNCDAEVDEMISDFEFCEEAKICEFGKSFTLTHGHKKNKDNMNGVNTDVLLYGHFHVPFIEEVNGIIVASPGSTSLPKDNSENSYMVIDEVGIKIYGLLTNELLMSKDF